MPFWRALITLALLTCTGATLASVLRPASPGPNAARVNDARPHPPTAPELPRDAGVLGYPRLLPVSANTDTTPLLVSNSPETPQTPGLLYRDRIQGVARVTAYHVNGLGQVARLLIVAEQTGDRAAGQGTTITLLRRGSAVTAGPDPVIGQQTLLRYFASSAGDGPPLPLKTVPLASGSRRTLYDSGPLRPGQVVSVLLDLFTDEAVTVSTYMLRAGQAPGPELPTLAPDGFHQRGTFIGANRDWNVVLPGSADPETSPLRLMFSDASDPPLTGTDALTGRPQQLRGSFGVLYRVSLHNAAGFLMAASARGGPYRGSLILRETDLGGQVGRTPLLIGRGHALLDGALPEAVWQLRSDTAHFDFIPANGSNLPLALVFYPGGTRRPVR